LSGAFFNTPQCIFFGEHLTRKTWFDYQGRFDKLTPARTIYPGNYIVNAEGLKFIIPFGDLRFRMSGPTAGRLIKAEIGAGFASANLPMLHQRTQAQQLANDFRPGVKQTAQGIDLSDEFERQFFGDLMLFSVADIAAQSSDGKTFEASLVSEILNMPNSNKVFDSSQIPGEIIDLMVVNTETLKKNPKLGKALTGAWYEIMATMSASDKKAIEARTAMGKASGADLKGYDAQLASTKMFYKAADAVSFTNSSTLKDTMAKVAKFSFDHGLLGDGAPDAGFIGVETPAGIYGDKKNVKLRFNPAYMQMAVDGKL